MLVQTSTAKKASFNQFSTNATSNNSPNSNQNDPNKKPAQEDKSPAKEHTEQNDKKSTDAK